MSELQEMAEDILNTIEEENRFYECYRKGCFIRKTKAKFLQKKR